MIATLQLLGVMPSLSRPGVSNDNPYSESLSKTLKYRPAYPFEAFDIQFPARAWVGALVRWYNHEHHHSAIRFVTPAQRHADLDQDIRTFWTNARPSTKLQGSAIRCDGKAVRATGNAYVCAPEPGSHRQPGRYPTTL